MIVGKDLCMGGFFSQIMQVFIGFYSEMERKSRTRGAL